MNPAQLTAALKEQAGRLGFSLAGVCPAITPAGFSQLAQWIAQGYAGQMDYIPRRYQAYSHPRYVLDGARCLLVLAANYRTREPARIQPGQGRISRYAWGDDYHEVLHQRLGRLADFLRQLVPQALVRGVVDTAPLMEREFAQLAGLGWAGKNTLLLHRELGSWFFLCVLLTDIELVCDAPHETDHCGTCRACLDACPTSAFVDARLLDSRRCISYLTIEHKGPIPRELRPLVGDWVFGCDICQEVCPWNHKHPPSGHQSFAPRAGHDPLDLIGLFSLDDAAFRAMFRHTPLWRPRRRGLLRNAAIVLGNHPTPEALPALARGLADEEPLVRGASAWALGSYLQPGATARDLLASRLANETDPEVRHEIEWSLGEMPKPPDTMAQN
jgi:epoxyqueuosine reductase